MPRIATACVLLLLAAAPGAAAAQQPAPITVAVLSAETSDSSLDLAARLTGALRTTAELNGQFVLYDTLLTKRGQRSTAWPPTQYVCLSRVSRTRPGWAQVTISFMDAPNKEPTVRLGSPVLVAPDSAFLPVARLAWARLAKVEQKRLDSLRGRRG